MEGLNNLFDLSAQEFKRSDRLGPSGSAVLSGRLEEGVAEDPVPLRRPVQVPDPRIELVRPHQPGRQGRLPDPLDHGGEGLPSEAIGHRGPGPVGVDHPGGDGDLGEPGPDEEGVELPAYHGVSPRPLLEPHLAVDGPLGGGAVRAEVGGAVVPLDGRDRPAGPYELLEDREGLDGSW